MNSYENLHWLRISQGLVSWKHYLYSTDVGHFQQYQPHKVFSINSYEIGMSVHLLFETNISLNLNIVIRWYQDIVPKHKQWKHSFILSLHGFCSFNLRRHDKGYPTYMFMYW